QHVAWPAHETTATGQEVQHSVGHDRAIAIEGSAVGFDTVHRVETAVCIEGPQNFAAACGVGTHAAVSRTGKHRAGNCRHSRRLARTATGTRRAQQRLRWREPETFAGCHIDTVYAAALFELVATDRHVGNTLANRRAPHATDGTAR